MTGTERIKALLNGTAVDRTPISGWLHMPTVDRYIDRFVAEEIAFTDQNGWDFIKVMPNGHHLAEAYGAKIHFLEDPKRWSADILEYPIRTVEDLVKLPVLDPKENPVLKREVEVVRRLTEHYKGTKPILPTLFNPITWVQEMNQSTVPGPTLDFLRNHKKELHAALETILQTNLQLADAYIEAGADGFFYASQFASSDLLSPEEFKETNTDYDLRFFEAVKDRTWFNLLHVHGDKNLYFSEFAKYPVQAINWENAPADIPEAEITSVAKARSLFDGILVGGTDQHHDFNGSRAEVKETLTRRLNTALSEDPTGKFILAPGCALPLDVEREIFTLFKEVVEEH